MEHCRTLVNWVVVWPLVSRRQCSQSHPWKPSKSSSLTTWGWRSRDSGVSSTESAWLWGRKVRFTLLLHTTPLSRTTISSTPLLVMDNSWFILKQHSEYIHYFRYWWCLQGCDSDYHETGQQPGHQVLCDGIAPWLVQGRRQG